VKKHLHNTFILALLAGCIVQAGAMDLATNLCGNSYYGDQLHWKDAMKSAKWWYCIDVSTMKGVEGATIPMDENLYPVEVPHNGLGVKCVSLVEVWEGVYPLGTYTLQFEGSGEVVLSGTHEKRVSGSGGTTRYEFTVTREDARFKTIDKYARNPRSSQYLYVAITRSAKADPVRNIHVLFPGMAHNYSDDDPFHPDFENRLKTSPYTIVRMMDWANVNYSMESSWNERTRKGSAIQVMGFGDKYRHGVAWEYQIDICNKTGKDLWLNFPAYADDDYLDQLAALVYEKLDPSLNVYLEYANETWNGMFVGYEAAIAVSRKLNLAPIDKAWQHNNYGSTYQLLNAARRFHSAFGAQKGRIKTILSGWANGSTWSQLRINAIGDPKVNPTNIKVDYFATTSYYGAPATVDKNLAPGGNWSVHKEMADKAGLEYIAYESGILGGMPRNQLYDAYTYALTRLSTVLSIYDEFLFTNQWSPSSTCGALEYFAQPLEDAPKYRALCDFAAKNNGWETGIAPPGVTIRSSRTTGHVTGAPLFDLRGRMVSPAASRSAITPLSTGLYLDMINTAGTGRTVYRLD